MKQITFVVFVTFLSLCLSANANEGSGGNTDEHPNHYVHPRNRLPGNDLTANAAATGFAVGGGAVATGVNGNISPTQHTTVGPLTNQLNGNVSGTFHNDGRQSTVVTTQSGDSHAQAAVGNVRSGDVIDNSKTQVTMQGPNTHIGPVSSTSSSEGGKGGTGGTAQATGIGSGNVTEINYDAPKIPVATAATLLLPPVVCASSSSGFGVQTQVFGFNFGSANSRERCWQSKEATECVNLAVATSSLFGMRRRMALVAVGCTVQSPSFRDFAKELGKEPVELAKEILASYGEEQKMVRDAEYSQLQEKLAAEQNARKQAEAQRDALALAKEAKEAASTTPPKTPMNRAKRPLAKKVCPC